MMLAKLSLAVCAKSWFDNWARTAQNRYKTWYPLALLFHLKVLNRNELCKGKKQKNK